MVYLKVSRNRDAEVGLIGPFQSLTVQVGHSGTQIISASGKIVAATDQTDKSRFRVILATWDHILWDRLTIVDEIFGTPTQREGWHYTHTTQGQR